jgi:hypothetical protein
VSAARRTSEKVVEDITNTARLLFDQKRSSPSLPLSPSISENTAPVAAQIDEAFAELVRPAEGRMLLKMGSLLYDPAKDQYYESLHK